MWLAKKRVQGIKHQQYGTPGMGNFAMHDRPEDWENINVQVSKGANLFKFVLMGLNFDFPRESQSYELH